ncbi:hypothetical protein OV207_04205 [Corallococcus sp. BB11-1]|uniref:RHS repeat-associated core domain-containing protein n=1 Tax=Corallococcus sp. BB11-1 TaxID=2996783 RepID=UPI0022719997|nr:RHS repeat-associated core domain-containing protein [Corallococcus sp. BB11-1]MCY1030650.1 hypothetical protein [Corallococcus sp. BB11-1]
MSRSPWLGLAMGLVAVMWPVFGGAQISPMGGHYGGRASDTGTEPGSVNASGGFSASVPLDFPNARGGLPVPVAIGSGARGVGAVGLGWDIPLTYIRRDTTFANRRPKHSWGGEAPVGREQVLLSLQGQMIDLVPKGTTWVARTDAPDLSLKQEGVAWVMYDGEGRTWTFHENINLAGVGLWLLTSITGTNGNTVQLEYELSTPELPGATGASGVTLDLKSVRYNKHPQEGCYKHELTFTYGPNEALPLRLSMMADRVVTRLRTLSTLDVSSRATCASGLTRLSRYSFTYLPDADTKQPRLSAVHQSGRQGTPEASVALPVASFGYGSATTDNKLKYQLTQTVAQPAGVHTGQISGTSLDTHYSPPAGGGTGFITWQSLTDVTGDGRPDVVFKKNDKLWVALNRPAAGGTTTLGAGTGIAQLADATFATGPWEVHGAAIGRFSTDPTAINHNRTWRQAIDVNGDGRVDVIDASKEPGNWVVYLNTPGTGASGVTWLQRTFNVSALYNVLVARGHTLSGNYLPLASRTNGRSQKRGACWRFDGGRWKDYPDGWGNGLCGERYANGLLEADSEQTFTEWELKDLNGDGFPDLVFNSSRVAVVPDPPPNPEPDDTEGLVINIPRAFNLRPLAGADNQIEAVINVGGPAGGQGNNPFSAPITIQAHASCGVGNWYVAQGSVNHQGMSCALVDVNGDALVDRVQSGKYVSLGTGSGFTKVQLILPSISRQAMIILQKSIQEQSCLTPNPRPPGDSTFFAWHEMGMRDLTGDGIPDFMEKDRSTGEWFVSVGTGAGFAPPVNIEVDGSVQGFSLSSERERCDGWESFTRSGLYDLDGDGMPEVVGLSGSNLNVYQLVGGSRPGKPEAGRLVQMDNGYGARTTVGYRSAKEDTLMAHQVPFPEIVATSVETTGTQGLGGTLVATRYAYGGAELKYNSVLQSFALPGYQRSVALRSTVKQSPYLKAVIHYEGTATLTDTYPLPEFTPADATTKNDRFNRYLRAGKVRDITTFSAIGTDPWVLLGLDVNTDPRRLGATHYDWASKVFEEIPGSGTSVVDCIEMVYPYDYNQSVGDALGSSTDFFTCSAHGFLHATATRSWRGQAAPPSTNNVQSASEVRAIDDQGRILNVLHKNDLAQSDDDICIETQYATPTGTGPRVLHALRSRRYWYCDKTPYLTYASDSWTYDNLPSGSVSAGRPTSHTRDRYQTKTGALLGSVRLYDASYDGLTGNVTSVTRQREDGALRVETLTHDAFGLLPVSQRTDATGLPALITTITRDPISLAALSTLDENQTREGTDYDGYGRPVRTTLTPPGGTLGVTSTTTYLGFSGTDPLGRRVVAKVFNEPVLPGTEASAPGRTATGFVDELGRERSTVLELGGDYAYEKMIIGERTYDGFGRVKFAADPYPTSQAAATAYGTTAYFNADGTPLCNIQGHGPQTLATATDEAAERYPTCYTRTFANNQEVVTVSDASSLLAGSAQAGVTRTATMTAAGRVLSRSTMKGTARLEHATFTHDRLGYLTSMTRFLEPVAPGSPVQSTWTYDSFGQPIEWKDPEGALQSATYSHWGDPLEVSWTDATRSPTAFHRLISQYDALGRLKHQEELTNGVVEPGTQHDYFYDVGVSATSLILPTNVLGRLAWTKSTAGNVYYSYDAQGRANARTFIDSTGTTYVEKMRYRADGALAEVGFHLPDTDYDYEGAVYQYDSANRLTQVRYSDNQELYLAEEIDVFGRVRKALHGGATQSYTVYADVGRRMLREASIASSIGSRRIVRQGYDPMGREKSRVELDNGLAKGVTTTHTYDALGRLAGSVRANSLLTLSRWGFTYDALGNVVTKNDLTADRDTALSYRSTDRDQICRVGYGNGGLGGTLCNILHDARGNVVSQPTPGGMRTLSYFPSGAVRSISDLNGQATFHHGALGTLFEIDLQGANAVDARHEWQMGNLLERRDRVVNGTVESVITRNIPGAGGIVASRRGYKQDWVYPFGESRGGRHFMDRDGDFVQRVHYEPFGEASSSGTATPGTSLYTSAQWNGGDALAAFGLSNLGARIYDPVLGRFLSRDPLLLPRTAASTHPYAFAMNDPVNLSDPSGLDVGGSGEEGPGGGGGFPGGNGGPTEINPIEIYVPGPGQQGTGGANPQSTIRPTPGAVLSQASGGTRTVAGHHLMVMVAVSSGFTSKGFDFDTYAATGAPLSAAIDAIANTDEGAEALVASQNAGLDRISNFSSGVGDSVIFWCPGCTQNMRSTWNIGSNVDPGSTDYLIGSITGIAGSIAAPKPTSIIRPPRVDSGPALAAETSQVGMGRLLARNKLAYTNNCGNRCIAGYHTIRGSPASASHNSGQGMRLAQLEQHFPGSVAVPARSLRGIAKTVATWKDGSIGIVAGIHRNNPALNHVTLVRKYAGQVYFIEPGSLRPYKFARGTKYMLMQLP